MKRATFILMIFCLFMAEIAKGQATVLGNAPGSNRFLGFNSNSTLPLPIRNDGNQPIEFSTNLQLRMTLAGDGRFVFNSTLPLATASFNINALSGYPSALRVNSSNNANNNFGLRISTKNGNTTNTGALVKIDSDTPSDYNQGIAVSVNGAPNLNYGVRALASGATEVGSANFGVLGTAVNPPSVIPNTYNYGVRGEACGGRVNIGVYGTNKPLDASCFQGLGLVYYAGYFAGNVVHNGSEINPSDENLKTNITPLEGATEILAQLQPKTYNFLTDEYDFMGLPGDLQYGLISQEVQTVLPELVHETVFPAQTNLQGEELSPQVDFLGLEYKPFIPILIAALNEQHAEVAGQQASITAQNETIESLQDKITALENHLKELTIAFQESHSINPNGEQGGLQQGAMKEGATLEQNTPNPFDEQTTIFFEIPKNAQVKLEISDASGRLLETLQNGRMEAGRHQVRWDAGRYPGGVYYYSLYADTMLLTKKMIKK